MSWQGAGEVLQRIRRSTWKTSQGGWTLLSTAKEKNEEFMRAAGMESPRSCVRKGNEERDLQRAGRLGLGHRVLQN